MSENNRATRVMTGLEFCAKPRANCDECPYREYGGDCLKALVAETFEYVSNLRNSILKQTLLMLTGKESTVKSNGHLDGGELSQLYAATAVNIDNCLDEPVAFPDTPVNLKIDGFYEG